MTLPKHQQFRQRVFLAYARLTRGMTLGVRAMLLREGQVVLVRHSYVSGWYLPGGGVEVGESMADALKREIGEEAGAVLTGPAELFGIYRNAHADVRDHVGLYVCRQWERNAAFKVPNREIIATELFSLDALPTDISSGTQKRLSEVLKGEPSSPDW
jgi:ADP-ribose pyrophosphatase YjhB (NUDIX family)